MKKLLITGFDPFGGQSVNPSWEAVKRLPETIGAYEVTKLQLPTVFGAAAETLLAAADRLQPRRDPGGGGHQPAGSVHPG